MAIDVHNHIWVGVFSASFVHQFEEDRRLTRLTGDANSGVDRAVRFAEKAKAVADLALESYDASNRLDRQGST